MYIWQHVWSGDKKTKKKRDEAIKAGIIEVRRHTACMVSTQHHWSSKNGAVIRTMLCYNPTD
jgi:hypothetical protein